MNEANLIKCKCGNLIELLEGKAYQFKKDDGKLYPFGVQLFVDREERFTSSKDNSIAYCMDINPGDEYDMWIGFEAPVVNSWTYYLEGSFGYIFQPTGYTGYLIELDIEDRG